MESFSPIPENSFPFLPDQEAPNSSSLYFNLPTQGPIMVSPRTGQDYAESSQPLYDRGLGEGDGELNTVFRGSSPEPGVAPEIAEPAQAAADEEPYSEEDEVRGSRQRVLPVTSPKQTCGC